MIRAPWMSSDTPRIRAAAHDLIRVTPIGFAELLELVRARTGLEVGERRLHRALKWLRDSGRIRRVRAENWREPGGYVRVSARKVTA